MVVFVQFLLSNIKSQKKLTHRHIFSKHSCKICMIIMTLRKTVFFREGIDNIEDSTKRIPQEQSWTKERFLKSISGVRAFARTFHFLICVVNLAWFFLQQHPPDPLPPWLPDGMLGLAGECWGPILIPFAWKDKQRNKNTSRLLSAEQRK